jgi:uncharacterized cupredoxin-like copper-binding protein
LPARLGRKALAFTRSGGQHRWQTWPGKTKSKTLTLKKGHYALVCNIAKHYALGMRAPFTVT